MSDAGVVSRRGRNLEGAKNEGSIYGVFFAGSGEPEAGIDFLKIGKKIGNPALLNGPQGRICRKIPFLSFRQVENCRLGNFLLFRQFRSRPQTGLAKRADAVF